MCFKIYLNNNYLQNSSFYFKFFLLITFFVFNIQANAAKSRGKNISFSSQYNTFKDLKLDSTGEETILSPSISIDIGYRLGSIFSFLLNASQSKDNIRAEYGLGFKIDLPGFFFIGSRKNDLSRTQKLYPFNTSIFALPVMTTTRGSDGVESKSLSSIFGFSMDVFLFNELTFLTFSASLYGLEGNTYIMTGAGLGVEF